MQLTQSFPLYGNKEKSDLSLCGNGGKKKKKLYDLIQFWDDESSSTSD